MDLKGTSIVIIGGSGDLGRGMAAEYCERGAQVLLVARKEQTLQEAVASLPAGQASYYVADASQRAEMQAVLAYAKQKFGQLDSVIVSIGEWARSSIDTSREKSDQVMADLWRSMFEPTRIALDETWRFFLEHGEKGLIAHISSHAASRFLPFNFAYGAVKAGLSRYVGNAKGELSSHGIRVVDVQPAIVDTKKNREAFPQVTDWSKAIQAADVASRIAEQFEASHPPEVIHMPSDLVL